MQPKRERKLKKKVELKTRKSGETGKSPQTEKTPTAFFLKKTKKHLVTHVLNATSNKVFKSSHF
jgi:hypothetical protein